MAEKPEEQVRADIEQFLAMAAWAVRNVAQASIHAARGVALPEFPRNADLFYGAGDFRSPCCAAVSVASRTSVIGCSASRDSREVSL